MLVNHSDKINSLNLKHKKYIFSKSINKSKVLYINSLRKNIINLKRNINNDHKILYDSMRLARSYRKRL